MLLEYPAKILGILISAFRRNLVDSEPVLREQLFGTPHPDCGDMLGEGSSRFVFNISAEIRRVKEKMRRSPFQRQILFGMFLYPAQAIRDDILILVLLCLR